MTRNAVLGFGLGIVTLVSAQLFVPGCSGGDSAPSGTGGSTTSGSGGSTGGGTGGSTGGGTGGSTGGGTGGGGGSCSLPVGTTDGATCTGTAMCTAGCGIENQGGRPCTCTGTVQDCGSCLAPTAANRPITAAATTCMDAGSTDGTDAEPFRNSACTTAGASCVATNTTSSGGARGCVCWDLDGSLKWRCGSTNSWFAVTGR